MVLAQMASGALIMIAVFAAANFSWNREVYAALTAGLFVIVLVGLFRLFGRM